MELIFRSASSRAELCVFDIRERREVENEFLIRFTSSIVLTKFCTCTMGIGPVLIAVLKLLISSYISLSLIVFVDARLSMVLGSFMVDVHVWYF